MTIQKFEEKYKDKGGIEKLTEMRALLFSQRHIANHFGVTRDRVRQWTIQFFGRTYDPRPEKKDAIIASMFEFAQHNSFAEFRFAFLRNEYYKETLKICKDRKIYA